MARDKQEKVTIEVYVEHVTAKALKCTETSMLEDIDPPEFWLPLSQIEIINIDPEKGYYTIEVPEWLAIEKGLV